MEKQLKIDNIENNGKKLHIKFEMGNEWRKYLKNKEMFIEYTQEINDVPKSISIIPIICNLLPIMWINDLSIVVDELDEKFFLNIEKIKNGYKKMYQDIDFKGNLIISKLIKNSFEGEKKAVMFSGGVDAYNTLVCHINEKPDLITIFGADIDLNDETGITIVKNKHNKIASKLGVNFIEIYSNFRTIVKYKEINNVVKNVNCKYEWWHDFQHGIALLGLTAPISYVNKYDIVYIASSFTESDKGSYTCASDPTIDNYFCHSSSKTIHDGYEYNRQDKIHNICDYVYCNNKSIELRVCWQSDGGENCCECEKCYRTILGIIAEGKNPKDYGFKLNEKIIKKMNKSLKFHFKYLSSTKDIPRYTPIQKQMQRNKNIIPQQYKWIINTKIQPQKSNVLIKVVNYINTKKYNLKKRIKKIFHK